MSNLLRRNILYVLGGAALALASLFPGGIVGVVCGCLAALFFVLASRREISLEGWFVGGLIFHAMAFYWLAYTIVYFGNFPSVVAALFFVVFCAVSSLQFVCCGWLCKYLESNVFLKRICLALPLSWLVTEFLFPRMFPWDLAHTQIAWRSFASYASLFGVYPLSFLMIWSANFAVTVVANLKGNFAQGLWKTVGFAACIFAFLYFGEQRFDYLRSELDNVPGVKLGIVQGNLEAKTKSNVLLLQANLETYREISAKVIADGAELLIWPESVITKWIDERVKRIEPSSRFHPFPETTLPLLYGGLSYRLPSADELDLMRRKFPEQHDVEALLEASTKYFNTAFGIDAAGQIVGRYHKKVLMPFGEYLPFADTFPSIKKLSPQSGDFSKGDLSDPLEFHLSSGKSLRASVLICYEDLIPSLSIDAVRHGGQVLVNLTNDAWYGNTAAPHQHNLLASWRAIETERYLVRVTNTGVTAVIDPLGRTVVQLPVFKADSSVVTVHPLDNETAYVRFGDIFTRVAVIGALVCVIVAYFRSLTGSSRSISQ